MFGARTAPKNVSHLVYYYNLKNFNSKRLKTLNIKNILMQKKAFLCKFTLQCFPTQASH